MLFLAKDLGLQYQSLAALDQLHISLSNFMTHETDSWLQCSIGWMVNRDVFLFTVDEIF